VPILRFWNAFQNGVCQNVGGFFFQLKWEPFPQFVLILLGYSYYILVYEHQLIFSIINDSTICTQHRLNHILFLLV
jgi:hypothetical protein